MVLPLNEECHEKRLRDRGIYSEPQIEYTLSRAELYKSYNQNHPGFFDMMINSGKDYCYYTYSFIVSLY